MQHAQQIFIYIMGIVSYKVIPILLPSNHKFQICWECTAFTFLCGSCDAGDLGLIPGSERSSGGGNNNSIQYSCLENRMDRGAWWATAPVAKSQTQLSD